MEMLRIVGSVDLENLSVVIPTLGSRQKSLDVAIESIEQHHSQIKVVIVAPLDVCDSLKIRYGRLNCIRILEDEGLGLENCIDTALRNIDTKYWTWIGDDDQLVVSHVAQLIQVLEDDSKISFVFGDCSYINEVNSVIGRNNFGWLAPKIIWFGPNLIPQPSCIFRTRASLDVGGLDSGLSFAFDQHFIQKLMRNGKHSYVRGVSSLYKFSLETLTSRNRIKSIEESFKVRLMFSRSKGMKTLNLILLPLNALIVSAAHLFFSKKNSGIDD